MYHIEPSYFLSEADAAGIGEAAAQAGKIVLREMAAMAVLALLALATAGAYARLIEAAIDDPTGRSILPIYWLMLGAL